MKQVALLFTSVVSSLLILIGTGCKEEPIYQISPPLTFISWASFVDTNYNTVFFLNNKPVRAKVVSNFIALSPLDTQTSIRVNFEQNETRIQSFVVKFRNKSNSLDYNKNDIVNIYAETEIAIYNANDIVLDSSKFQYVNNRNLYLALFSNSHFEFHTTSVSQPNLTISISNSQSNVLNSYFKIYTKNKWVQLDRELWNVDLKGGSEYNPTPLIDFIPDVRFFRDYVFSTVPTKCLNNELYWDIERNCQYNKSGKFHVANSAKINVSEYYFKDKITAAGEGWQFTDSTTMTTLIKVDSLQFRYHYMPF
jgi:hypothetical protein